MDEHSPTGSLRYLAKKYHIDLRRKNKPPNRSRKPAKRESLFNLNEFARRYFSSYLFDTKKAGAVCLAYSGKGNQGNIIKEFPAGVQP